MRGQERQRKPRAVRGCLGTTQRPVRLSLDSEQTLKYDDDDSDDDKDSEAD